MKRSSLIASFVLFLLLCASIAYWGLQFFKPPLRPVAAPPRLAKSDINPQAAATLFGGRAGKAAVASNYQLKGVVMSGRAEESVAILSTEGKPAQAIRVDGEVAPGVKIKEVHRDYVLLSDAGAVKRVELPENAKSEVSPAAASSVRAQPQPAPPPPAAQMPAPAPPTAVVSPAAPAAQQAPAAGAAPPAIATPSTPAPSAAPAAQSTVPPAVVVSPPNPQAGTPVTPGPTLPTAPAPPAAPGTVPQQPVSPPDGAAARMQGSTGLQR